MHGGVGKRTRAPGTSYWGGRQTGQVGGASLLQTPHPPGCCGQDGAISSCGSRTGGPGPTVGIRGWGSQACLNPLAACSIAPTGWAGWAPPNTYSPPHSARFPRGLGNGDPSRNAAPGLPAVPGALCPWPMTSSPGSRGSRQRPQPGSKSPRAGGAPTAGPERPQEAGQARRRPATGPGPGPSARTHGGAFQPRD